jgi:hypothetical protein
MFIEQIVIVASREILTIGRFQIDIWWWPYLFVFFKSLMIILTLILIVATVLVFYRFQSVRIKIYDAIGEAIESGKLSKENIVKKWEEIKQMSESDVQEDKSKAVISAEEILDNALKSANYAGENLEKRIEKVPDNLLNFKEDIVWAHRIKNQFVSGSGEGVGKEEVERAIYIFERALKELNIL